MRIKNIYLNIAYQAFCIMVLLPCLGFSQNQDNWQHLDPEEDHVLGISSYKAYEFLKNRRPDTVIVAIIDNGAELTHEDLVGKFWINVDEIPDNQIDDDRNGYTDDINGWNFLGNSKGSNLKFETMELTRLYANYHKRFLTADSASLDTVQLTEYLKYREIKKDYESEVNQKKKEIASYNQLLSDYIISDSIIRKHLKKDVYIQKDVKRIRSKKLEIITAKEIVLKFLTFGISKKLLENMISNLTSDLETRLNPDLKVREEIIMDDPYDINDSIYGNNMLNVMGPGHGTGVVGVLGATKNETGIDGIAGAVKFMILRVVPNGDERDKDVALAIKYAVRNGADIINCSFGKKYSAQPGLVQDAIVEAEIHNVVIVHAAGNDGEDTDKIRHYPSGILKNGKMAENWINVGASTSDDNENLVAGFSNYGKKTVDIFAPGYNIKTCALNDEYDSYSGTSIAAPIVSGVAAVLKSYFPKLTAREIKEIIIRSAYIPKTTYVKMPGQSEDRKANFSELSVSGGIINLYRAVMMADTEYCDE